MNNFIPPDPNDPRLKLIETLKRRKELQLINQMEETDAMVETKEKIKEMEGQEMREIMQVQVSFCISMFFLKINDSFINSKHVST